MSRRILIDDMGISAALLIALTSTSTSTVLAAPAPRPARRRDEPPFAPAAYRAPKEKAQWKRERNGRR